MKKRICFVLVLVLLFSAVSCNGSPNPTPENPSTSQTDEGPGEITLFTGSADGNYRIVVPESATEAQAELSARLVSAAKEITGKTVQRVNDQTGKYPEQAKEILLGPTARAETQDLLGKLGDSEYRIRYDGEKIVILASNDTLLSDAVETWIASWRCADAKVTVIAQDQMKQAEASPVLAEGDRFQATVVLDSDLSDETRKQVTTSFVNLRSRMGVRGIAVIQDEESPLPAESVEILIGDTNRAESRSALNLLQGAGYRIEVTESKIAVVASDEAHLVSAVSALCDMLVQIKAGTVKGNISLYEVRGMTKTEGAENKEWLEHLPDFKMGELTASYAETANSLVRIYDRTVRRDYEGYLAELAGAGFTGTLTSNLGENLYCCYENAKSTVFVSFSAVAGRTRVYAEQKGDSNYPAPADETAGTEATVPHLWQLEVDNKNTKANGGMSYIFQCANGNFFIIDGGYGTDTEADRIYRFLQERTPEGQKPVIEGWFISHLHDDHYGALLRFADKYSSKVDVLTFYYHFTPLITVKTAMGRWRNAVHYGRLHTGMNFSVAGLRIDVLYTMEDLFPVVTENVNEASTVIRVTAGGQRILFLGDIMSLASERMLAEIPADALKSDLVQVAHHGYDGASVALYQAIDPETLLWPMNIVGWQDSGYLSNPQNVFGFWYERTRGEFPLANHWLTHTDSIKKIFVAGFGTTEIPLPYTPEGEKIGDFDAYYEENKNQ